MGNLFRGGDREEQQKDEEVAAGGEAGGGGEGGPEGLAARAKGGTMRITIKGGVWKNTEDEILKAAVMKYGKNQWARVSSLLVRKSAKQCKARWFEWLDPSIKKTDWTREEDEKLLHLAKLMPTQWRTIAPIVGRTSAQCLERYEQLLDEASGGGGGSKGAGSAPGNRKVRPGEIDSQPETRPARPDPVDMDEDEKEMLNEARARLANTKGKKAKRKAREKQLEEARRLASLQKKRELRAAGIDGGRKGKDKRIKKGMIDYNAEIAFEHKPPPGFFDTADEERREREEARAAEARGFKPVSLQDLEGPRRKDIEAALIKQDRAKQQINERKNMPLVAQQMLEGQAGPSVRRGKMSLPAPQLSDAELSQISRMSAKEGAVEDAVAEGAGGRATKMLLADYAATPNPMTTPARTPRALAASGGDVLLQEAQQLASMERQQSTLMGGEGAKIDRATFSGAMPPPKSRATPNPLATPLNLPPPTGATPSVLPTPLRDGLQINRKGGFPEPDDELEQRRALDVQRQSVKLGLGSLPKPKNEYQVVIPDLPEAGGDEDDEDQVMEDMADVIAKRRQREEEERRRELRMRSQAVQRGLPRPTADTAAAATFDIDLAGGGELGVAELLIVSEVRALIDRDYASGGNKAAGGGHEFAEEEILSSRQAIREEAGRMVLEMGGEDAVAEAHGKAVEALRRGEEEMEGKNLAFLRANFSGLKAEMERQSKLATKLEKKIGILTGGLISRHGDLASRLAEARRKHEETTVRLSSLREVRDGEMLAAPQRLEALRAEVELEREKERELQARYANAIR